MDSWNKHWWWDKLAADIQPMWDNLTRETRVSCPQQHVHQYILFFPAMKSIRNLSLQLLRTYTKRHAPETKNSWNNISQFFKVLVLSPLRHIIKLRLQTFSSLYSSSVLTTPPPPHIFSVIFPVHSSLQIFSAILKTLSVRKRFDTPFHCTIIRHDS